METRDKRTDRKIERHKIEDGVEVCFCSSEGIYKPCEEFTRSKTYEHGYDYRCKECTRTRAHSIYGSFATIEKEQRDILNKFYRQVGYDPQSPIPIHEQFLIRHDL